MASIKLIGAAWCELHKKPTDDELRDIIDVAERTADLIPEETELSLERIKDIVMSAIEALKSPSKSELLEYIQYNTPTTRRKAYYIISVAETNGFICSKKNGLKTEFFSA